MIGAMSGEFLLVHGMSHGGWAWDTLRARLERAGHRFPSPTFAVFKTPRFHPGAPRPMPPGWAPPRSTWTAHSPMLSAPDALARILTAVHRLAWPARAT
jgi:hypothetical protein